MPTLYGNIIGGRWRSYIDYTVTVNNATTYTISATMGLYNVQPYTSYNADGVLNATGKTKYTAHSSDIGDDTGQKWPLISNKTYSWSKTHATQSPNIACTMTTGGGSLANGTSSIQQALSIPAKTHYTVTFNANGGSGAPGAQTKWYGENLTLSATKPTRAGYQFNGWNTNSSGTGTNYASGGTYSANSAVTLYAKWTPNKVSIIYNANGGAVGGSYKMPYTGAYSYPNTINLFNISTFGLSRTGYHVDAGQEWNSKADGSGTNYNHNTDYYWDTFGSTSSANKTVNLYANWKVNSYTLTFDANGGSVSETTRSVNYNAAYGTLPTPQTRQYYRFDGWFTAANGGNQVSASTKMGASNTTIYAHWTRLYIPPTVIITTAKRSDESHRDVDDGTVPCISFKWTAGDDAGTVVTPSTYDVVLTNQDDPTEVYSVTGQSITASPITVYLDTITLAAEKAFDVEVIVHQTGYDDVSDTDYISQSYYIIDISSDGKGIAFGKPADEDGFCCAMDAVFTGDVNRNADTGETFIKSTRTDTDVAVGLGVGVGGENHGVYSYKSHGWIIHQTLAGKTHLKGTAFNDLFVVTEHNLTTSLTVASGNISNATYTATKSGYYPVGVVGWRTINGSGSGGSYAVCFGATMSSGSLGSASINVGIRAVGAVNNCTLRASILWIKDI